MFPWIETRQILGLLGIHVVFAGDHTAFVDYVIFESLFLVPGVAKSNDQHYEVNLPAHIACRIKKTDVTPRNCPIIGLGSLHDLEIRQIAVAGKKWLVFLRHWVYH